MATVIAAVPAVDATLEGTARSTLGKMTHELDDAAAEGRPGGQAARRHAPPAVRTDARPRLPVRRTAGAGGRPGLAAQPRRSGAGRDPRPGAAGRSAAPGADAALAALAVGAGPARARSTANFQGTKASKDSTSSQPQLGSPSACRRGSARTWPLAALGNWALEVPWELGVGSWKLTAEAVGRRRPSARPPSIRKNRMSRAPVEVPSPRRDRHTQGQSPPQATLAALPDRGLRRPAAAHRRGPQLLLRHPVAGHRDAAARRGRALLAADLRPAARAARRPVADRGRPDRAPQRSRLRRPADRQRARPVRRR